MDNDNDKKKSSTKSNINTEKNDITSESTKTQYKKYDDNEKIYNQIDMKNTKFDAFTPFLISNADFHDIKKKKK
jgi:hypothetical protein